MYKLVYMFFLKLLEYKYKKIFFVYVLKFKDWVNG